MHADGGTLGAYPSTLAYPFLVASTPLLYASGREGDADESRHSEDTKKDHPIGRFSMSKRYSCVVSKGNRYSPIHPAHDAYNLYTSRIFPPFGGIRGGLL